MIDFVKNWLGTRMSQLSNEELCSIYEEIHSLRKTGLLSGDARLRELDTEFRREHDCDSNLRLIEDAVLYEIGRRFYNYSETAREFFSFQESTTNWFPDLPKHSE